MLNFWKEISNIIVDESVVLLCVIDSEGSSPGRQGFKMVVSESGKMVGSIGGGFMEHKLVELAKKKLEKGKFPPFFKHQIHQSNIAKDRSGMICSGSQTIAFYHLDLGSLETLNKINQESDSQTLLLTEKGMEVILSDDSAANQYEFRILESSWEYKEQLRFKEVLYIIGGGHVGLAFSRTMKQLGFYIHLFDDREGLNTFEENQYVDEKQIVNYENIGNYITNEHAYIVLMSFGYRTDEVCIKNLIDKKYKYFGVMGSESKMNTLFGAMLKEGYSEEKIKKIHSPIGVPISSKTPEEIAISVAAEIIKIKNS